MALDLDASAVEKRIELAGQSTVNLQDDFDAVFTISLLVWARPKHSPAQVRRHFVTRHIIAPRGTGVVSQRDTVRLRPGVAARRDSYAQRDQHQ